MLIVNDRRSATRSTSSASFASPEPPEMREIATTRDGRDITRGYVDALPLLQPQDSVLRSRGESYVAYEEVLRDDQVITVWNQRRLAVVSREWEVVAGGDKRIDRKAAEHLEEQLRRLDWDAATDRMSFGIFYGFSVGELLYARRGGYVEIDQIKVRKQRRFGFGPDGSLKLLTMSNPNGEQVPERKFWVLCCGADNDDEPHGLALAHWLYWPVFFKRNDLKLWLIYLDKFGMPTARGTYPPGASEAEKSKLLRTLRAIQTDSGIILPQGFDVGLIEAGRSGSVDYGALYNAMNGAISKVTVGQTMTADNGSSLAQAQVHYAVRQDIVKADADLINGSFNAGPARWLTDWNFPGAAYPQVWRRIQDEPDLKPQAERDNIIIGWGFRPTLKYVNDTYGGEWELPGPPKEETSTAPPTGPAPVAPPDDLPDGSEVAA
jgi:hypothetical protein